jgi:hypothetical protein
MAAKLTNIAEHAMDLRIAILLYVLMAFAAMILGVTLYALTRDQDHDVAMLGLTCRLFEGISQSVPNTLALLWLATKTEATTLDTGVAHVLLAFLLGPQGGANAIFFAVGSTLFSWLFLRGRMIPVSLARLGVVASVLLVVILPLQLAGLLPSTGGWSGIATWLIWMPMLVFELVLAIWLLVKGVAMPAARQSPPDAGENDYARR